MKVFWSWQSDVPGRISRHFVRDALTEAIGTLKQAPDIEEPTREALHLDHDRQGIPGSPDLAPTIFAKIDQSAVFVADVTLTGHCVGENDKKFINSNVAIEYGYALQALSDRKILMIQNTHYGERDELPFDLQHKAGPIQYSLGPHADNVTLKAEQKKLKDLLVNFLKPYALQQSQSVEFVRPFPEITSITTRASFWEPDEPLATFAHSAPFGRADERIEYRFACERPFYLRVIPSIEKAERLSLVLLEEVAKRADVLTRQPYALEAARNRYGAIGYEVHGNSSNPRAITQLFRNGEIWGVTRDIVHDFVGEDVIPMVAVSNIYNRVLNSYVTILREITKFDPPYTVEMGANGIGNLKLLDNRSGNPWGDHHGPIYDDTALVRCQLEQTTPQAERAVVEKFCRELYDLAGVTPPQT